VAVFFSTITYAQNINYIVSDKHSFTMKKGALDIKSAYLKINDTIDVFNIKDRVAGDSNYDSVGDLDGYEFGVRYGISARDTILVDYQLWNVSYDDSPLKNQKIKILNRYNLVSSKDSFFNAFSIDVGYIRDSSKPLNITSDSSLNALIQKVKPGTTVKLNDGVLVKDGSTFAIYDKTGNIIKPYLSIENLKSDSYLARILVGKVLSPNNIIDFYIGAKFIDIKTSIDFYPKDNALLNSFIGDYKSVNLDRTEKSVELGFLYTLKVYKTIFEFNYEYTKIFRDKDVSYTDENTVIETTLAQELTKNALLYLGVRVMMQQFNTDVPYLYTKYTKTKFDKMYGFASFGALYRF